MTLCHSILACLALVSGSGMLFPSQVQLPATVEAQCLWQEGQRALQKGNLDEAIQCFRRGLELDPEYARNHLGLAAAFLEQRQDVQACQHLGEFLRHKPEQVLIRVRLADLLYRVGRIAEAKTEFERAVVDAQCEGGQVVRQLMHCHCQLMEIATSAGDRYHEHLHRGIGLYLLARQRSLLEGDDDGLTVESLLFKAAAELTLARGLKPQEARPSLYLHQVWQSLGQQHPARKYLCEAQEKVDCSNLTPAEHRSLILARHQRACDVAR